MSNVEAETQRRQLQVLRSKGFRRDFAECLAARASKDRLIHSDDLKRKYRRRGWKTRTSTPSAQG